MRLFVGVTIGDEALAVAEQTVRELRRRLADEVRLRWVEAANLHLTVRFIGEVAPPRESAVLEALRPTLPVAPFAIELGGCGVFPSSGPPRAIWIGLQSGLAPLTALHDEFDRRLAPLGFAPERRRFSAHLTLARVSAAPGGAARTVRQALAALHARSVRCTVAGATVFQSRLSPNGAVYQPLFDVRCAG
jgi:2'-5' RNA ligase